MFNWLTKDRLLHGLGTLGVFDVYFRSVVGSPFDVALGGFVLLLLGVAGTNAYFNSPAVQAEAQGEAQAQEAIAARRASVGGDHEPTP
jgi:predicted ribosomally synthesized peptide with SipW-like signal peptide